jgi:hypothetical protein
VRIEGKSHGAAGNYETVGLQGTRMLDFRLPRAVCYDVQRAMSGQSAAQATFLESGASFGQATSFVHSA